MKRGNFFCLAPGSVNKITSSKWSIKLNIRALAAIALDQLEMGRFRLGAGFHGACPSTMRRDLFAPTFRHQGPRRFLEFCSLLLPPLPRLRARPSPVRRPGCGTAMGRSGAPRDRVSAFLALRRARWMALAGPTTLVPGHRPKRRVMPWSVWSVAPSVSPERGTSWSVVRR